MRPLFYRNIYARDLLEMFLISAVSSLLLVRFYLHVAGYPQLGGANFHIAHMLYGGLLMMGAIVILLSFIGTKSRQLSAFVGGAGFGVFIDELGKFITKDNDYFFRPAVGIIYAIFAVLYLTLNFISRSRSYSSQEYQLNALQEFNEAVIKDMDRYEKTVVRKLLAKADQRSVLTKELQRLLTSIRPVEANISRTRRIREMITRTYDKFWQQKGSSHLVSAIFVAEAVIFLLVVIGTFVNSFDDINDLIRQSDNYSTKLLIGQLIASIAAATFAVIGTIKLVHSRLKAFEYFRRAILINLLLTQFFIFSRIEFQAIPGFLINLALLIALTAALHQEKRLLSKK